MPTITGLSSQSGGLNGDEYVPMDLPDGTTVKILTSEIARLARTTSPQALIVAVSDETTALTTGTAKITFRMPFAFVLTGVRAGLSTAQTSGSTLTVDINETGASILSTKLTIDNTEKTSTTAATKSGLTYPGNNTLSATYSIP